MSLKTWMKILMWVGLGGGIGFFAGFRAGRKSAEDEDAGKIRDAAIAIKDATKELVSNTKAQEANLMNSLAEYAGNDYDGDHVMAVDGDTFTTVEMEEEEMPEEPPRIGDEEEIEDIPQLHPEYMTPVQITDEEYYTNPWNDDQESLIFYELDEVLYNKDTQSAMTSKDEIDQVLGIGMTFQFYQKDGEALDTIFVRNPTLGTLFRVDRIDAAYEDEITGADAPDYEDDDEAEDED